MADDAAGNDKNGNSNAGPWWARFIERFGLPAAIAAFLIWFITNGQGAKLSSVDTTMNRAMVEMSQFATEQRRVQATVSQANETTIQVLQQICVSVAKTEAARDRCIVR